MTYSDDKVLPISLSLVDDALSVLPAGVGELLADGSLEEAFAALAGVDAVVLAGGPVAADGAKVLGPGQGRVVDGRGRAGPPAGLLLEPGRPHAAVPQAVHEGGGVGFHLQRRLGRGKARGAALAARGVHEVHVHGSFVVGEDELAFYESSSVLVHLYTTTGSRSMALGLARSWTRRRSP